MLSNSKSCRLHHCLWQTKWSAVIAYFATGIGNHKLGRICPISWFLQSLFSDLCLWLWGSVYRWVLLFLSSQKHFFEHGYHPITVCKPSCTDQSESSTEVWGCGPRNMLDWVAQLVHCATLFPGPCMADGGRPDLVVAIFWLCTPGHIKSWA